ncbi:MAG TPA: DUF4136 domain-containing protein [Thermoanaerobaculales bacterium]|nr:DUF4136 domain-containing protein [Thermoanaerobaculales bacterium]HPA80712.1 DUF4136 domain-containing protein [Thermoanaerobaculales bacterium]HQL29247.1 DUF4136 domain-containing protein [Thermoanaerobaculales bacterium]HQN96189.1 DUF4136 domain-containing protein [Thermoanaerobaculales bacterium]HQP43416.1 DUF4136 domain-containing protein [Thermoanaerobaculales bacterium]
MRYALGIAAVALLFVLPASAQDVNIDYAHEYDFSKVKTFQYVDAEDGLAPNELMHDRIVGAIQGRLTSVAGLRAVTESPDIVVTYHLSSRENTVYSTTAVGYGGYGGYWGGWRRYGGGMASATTTASTYTEGTLIIDAYDTVQKKLVWRGSGTVTVKDDPEKQAKQVDKIINKLGEKWKKIHAGQGK